MFSEFQNCNEIQYFAKRISVFIQLFRLKTFLYVSQIKINESNLAF